MTQKQNPLMLILLLVILALASGSILGFNVLNVGFEGAKCYGYGVYFNFDGEWQGTQQLHKYADAESSLATYRCSPATASCWQEIDWATLATPNDMGLKWEFAKGIITNRGRKPDLGVHVESNIQLADIDRQGDPLGWNLTEPMDARRIEYWSKTVVKEETDDKVTYHYNLTKESFLVVPAEFWIGFYLVPSQSGTGGTGSGWREGEYQNVLVWFMLDWTVWDNAYKDPWLDDPELNVFTSEHEGAVLNQQQTAEYRGGFPIAGWIQGWEKAGWTSAGPDENPVWLTTKGKEDKAYTVDQLAQLKSELMTKVQFAPSLTGQFLSLYCEPSVSFSYEAEMLETTDYTNNAKLANSVKAPDSSMRKTMYFPINIQNFGTLAKGDFWNGWTVYYPSCYLRVRMIYGVYGDFTYLWTEELAKDPTIDYPDEPEHHGTTVIHVEGAGAWWQGLITSPWTWLGVFSGLLILGLALFLFIILAVPGGSAILAGLFARRGRGSRG